ncbi:hypothetical protein GG344DRAFT_66184 [Lentinula edodes]|nr:hypothetical protein GG344DRAFT_66184 [Lentinula edodes]
MVHSHTVLTAVIAVGVASSALAAPINSLPEGPVKVIHTLPGTSPQNLPTEAPVINIIQRQVTSDPQLPPVVPAKSLNAREFDVIVEEDHPHPHPHHHEGLEVEVDEHHGEEFKLDFEEEHRYPHHPHHHHHGGEDFEVDVEFDEHHPHHHHSHHHHGEDFEVDVELEEHRPHHHHHGEDFEVDVELEEHRPHRHHGEENFEIEVEEHHHHHHHHHHHGGEHFEHKHHGHHAHHHEVEVVPIPIPVPVEHKDFMGRPPKVVKDEVWVVATEGKHVDIGRRQDEGGHPAPGPGYLKAHSDLMQQIQNFPQTPQGQRFSSNLREGVTKRSPVKSAVTGDPSQLSRRQGSTPSPVGTTSSTANIGSSTDDQIPSSPTLPMALSKGASGKHSSAQSEEWKAIKKANNGWRKDMDGSGGNWETFLGTPTGKAVKAKDDPKLSALVKHALAQRTNPNNPKSHQSPSEGATSTGAAGASATSAPGSGASSSSSTLNRRSGSSASGSSSSSIAGSSPNESPMGSPTSSTGPGFGATGSGASGALGSTSSSADSASPSGAGATTSAGYSSAHEQLKEQHREQWKKFKKANPTVKEDLEKANGNVQEFLQTPSGQALAKENKAFQKFVETHVVEYHKKHGQDHHHQSASSQQPASPDGSSSASSSPSSPASANGANSAPVGRSVLAARMGFGAHGSSLSTLPVNPHHGGHRHRVRSMPAEAGDASGTPGQTSALPIQSSSSTANGPGMGAVNGPPFPFSGTPSSAALSGPSTSGLPPSAPPNGNGQGPHPEGPGPHGHRFAEGPMGLEEHFGGPMGPEHHFGGPHHHNNFGGLPPANGNTGSVPGTPPNAASGASSLPPPPPSGATSQGMPGAPARRALQRVRRSTPYGDFGADLD